MKKRVFSIFTVIALAFTTLSCSSDDNGGKKPTEQDKLFGKWSATKEIALDANGRVVSTEILNNGACPSDVIDFRTANVLAQTFYSYSSDPTNCEEDKYIGSWAFSDKKINVNMTDEDLVFEIKELSEETLEIERPMKREESQDYELNVVTLKFVYTKTK